MAKPATATKAVMLDVEYILTEQKCIESFRCFEFDESI